MDKLKDRSDASRSDEKTERKRKRKSIFTKESRAKDYKGALIFDLVFLAIGVLFARCHIVFGARPLGLAYVSVLPIGVIPAALGVGIGALTLGKEGILYALAAAISVLLRLIISGGGKRDKEELFSENLLLRMSSAVISGFIGAVYEILLSGITQTTVLFGLSMILIPPVLTFVLSGIFSTGISLGALLYDTGNVFSFSKKRDVEKYNIVFFQLASLTALFFITLSLAEFEILGISLSYIFTSFMTLLVARRFGALRALAVGFFSAIGVSGIHAVGFALAGLGSGILFTFGTGFGIAAGLATLSAWSAYSGGLMGFVETLPEFLIASTLSIPLLRSISSERTTEEASESERSAAEMVGTMALTYRNKYTSNLDSLEASLTSLGSVIKHGTPMRLTLSVEEYRNLVCETADRHCKNCPELALCEEENINPCRKNAELLAQKLQCGEKIFPEDINTDTEFCLKADELARELAREAARAECDSFRHRESNTTAEEYDLIAKLIGEARSRDDSERTMNSAVSDKLSTALEEGGYSDWVVRAFGDRKTHVILAGEDKDGSRITSKELRDSLERGASARFGAAEFFRRGNMTLMECDSVREFTVECATASMPGDRREVSGDTVSTFESTDDRFFALISDGMGRGEIAKKTSEFVSQFLSRALNFGASKDTVLHLLNRAMRRGRDECSATVDLFELDLYNGEATFIKSGSAPSYVKRDSSIFRIRSQTAPIGLLSTIDSEKIRVEVLPDDYVIMLSDGISQSSDDAPWLLEFLSKPLKKESLKEYADKILEQAREYSASGDDMSVIVLKITKTK